MKRLLWVLSVLAVLAVVADFGAKLVVENLAARALSSRRGVNGSVDVSFGGFPFLLSLADRHFGSVTLEAEDVRSGGFATQGGVTPESEARMKSVTLELEDVTVEGRVWRGDSDGRVIASSGAGSATLSQAALNRMVPAQYAARLTLRDGSIRVTVTHPQLGAQEAELAEDQVRLESGTLVVEAPAPAGPIEIPLPVVVDGVVFEDVDVRDRALDLAFRVERIELKL